MKTKGKYPEYPADPIADVRDMFLRSTGKFADKAALQHKKDGRWTPISYRSLRNSVIVCSTRGRRNPVQYEFRSRRG